MTTINLRQNPSNSGGLTNAQIDTNFDNLSIDALTRAPSAVVWAATTAVVKGAILYVVDTSTATTTGSTVRHYLVTTAGTTGSTAPSGTGTGIVNGTVVLDYTTATPYNGIEILSKLNQIGNISLTSGSLGIGTTSLTNYALRVSKTITGAVNSFGMGVDGVTQSDVTSSSNAYYTLLGTQAAAFTLGTLRHFTVDQTTIGAGSIVTNQWAFQTANTLIGATNNVGFYGNIAAPTSGITTTGTISSISSSGTTVTVNHDAITYTAGQTVTIAATANITALTSGTTCTLLTLGTTTSLPGAATGSVTFTDVGDLVTYTAHGMADNTPIFFSAVTTTTGISINTLYYVINKTTNTFQVSATKGGSAIALTTNGTGTCVQGVFTANAAGTGTATVTLNIQGSGITIGTAASGTFTFTSTTNQTFAAVTVTGSVTVSTRFNLYMAGTAPNYMAGNVGIGFVPQSTSSSIKAIEMPSGGLYHYLTTQVHLTQGLYINSSNLFVNKSTSASSSFLQAGGAFYWQGAAAGTADALANGTGNLTTRMFLDASGNLGLGTTSPAYFLDSIGTARSYGFTSTAVNTPATPTAVGSTTGGSLAANTYYFKIVAVDGLGGVTLPSAESTVVTTTGTTSSIAVAWTATTGAKSYQIWYSNTTGTQANYFTATTNSFSFTTTTGNTAGTIPAANTTGNVLVGALTTSIAKKFTVVGEGNFADASNTTRLYMGFGTIPTTGGTGAYIYNSDNSPLVFGTSNTERMRIDASGRVSIGANAASLWGSTYATLELNSNGSLYGANLGLNIASNTYNDGTNWILKTANPATLIVGNSGPGSVIFYRFASGAAGSTASPVETLRIDSVGNLGVGTVTSAWSTSYRSIDIGNYSTIASFISNRQTFLLNNIYSNGTNWIYKSSGFGGIYQLDNSGQHVWYNAPSGTSVSAAVTTGLSYTVSALGTSTLAQWQAYFSALASLPTVGQVITATATGSIVGGGTVTQNIALIQALTLDASGNLGLGGTVGMSSITSLGSGLTTMEIKGGNGGGFRFINSGNTLVGSLYANATKLYMTSLGGLDATFATDSYIVPATSFSIGIASSTALSTFTNVVGALTVGGSAPSTNNGTLVVVDKQGATGTPVIDAGGYITLTAFDGAAFRAIGGIRAGKLNSTNADYSGYLDLQTRNNGSNLATVMRLNNNSTVGIGTSYALGPTVIATLDVGATSTTNTYTTTSAAIAAPYGSISAIRNTSSTVGTGAFQLYITTASTNQWYQGAVDAASYGGVFVLGNRTNTTAYTERLRVSATGDVTAVTGGFISTKTGVTTDGGGQIYLNGATSNRIDFNGNGLAAPAFTTRSAGTKIVLLSGVGASAVDYGIGVESGNMWYSTTTTSTGFKWYGGTTVAMTLSGAGALVATGNITAFSDARLKKDVVTIDNALEKTLQLRGVYFTRNDIVDAKREVGVIAQEVQKIVPELVNETENGTLTVAYGNTIALLIESIKTLNDKIDALDARINK